MPTSQLTPVSSSTAESQSHRISVSETFDDSDAVRPELLIVGKRVDDALDEVDKYLDRAFLSGLPVVTIVHGIGTGKLKHAVSTLLRSHQHVVRYTIAEHNQGATIVELKRR